MRDRGLRAQGEEFVKRSSIVASLCAVVALSGAAFAQAADEAAAAAASAVKGSMLVAANGARLAPVYRVGADGSAQIIIEGKMVTIPASKLSMAGGRLT